jgi:hypothetical protein
MTQKDFSRNVFSEEEFVRPHTLKQFGPATDVSWAPLEQYKRVVAQYTRFGKLYSKKYYRTQHNNLCFGMKRQWNGITISMIEISHKDNSIVEAFKTTLLEDKIMHIQTTIPCEKELDIGLNLVIKEPDPKLKYSSLSPFTKYKGNVMFAIEQQGKEYQFLLDPRWKRTLLPWILDEDVSNNQPVHFAFRHLHPTIITVHILGYALRKE